MYYLYDLGFRKVSKFEKRNLKKAWVQQLKQCEYNTQNDDSSLREIIYQPNIISEI